MASFSQSLSEEFSYENADSACSTAYVFPVFARLLGAFPEGSVVADLGCGNGSLLANFLTRSWELHGFEVSESGLRHARRAYPGIHFHAADLMADLSSHPLAGRCDVLISTEVVEHVFLPRRFAGNCYSFLKPGGKLILSTPYHGYLKNLALALSNKLDNHFTALWDYGHIKFWSARTIGLLLQEAGLNVLQVTGAGRLPYLWKSMIVVAVKPELPGGAR